MTLGEKSNLKPKIGLSGPELSGGTGLGQDDIYTFSEVVNSTCERLMDRQIKYSIRRIREMNERLCLIERELDEFLLKKGK